MGARTGRPRGWRDDPQWRRERALKAGAAAARAARVRAAQRASGLSPSQAYTLGDRNGYHRAYAYWRRWAFQTVERLTGRKVA